MTIYWILFLIPLVGVFFPYRTAELPRRIGIFAVGFTFVLAIGLRDHIGCDWGQYLRYYLSVENLGFRDALATNDPGYALLNWISLGHGLGVYAVNAVCALIFVYGLMTLCRKQPSYWTTLTLAVPYLVVVVAMGYTRQATALGFLMLGLSAIEDRRLLSFFFYVILASLFHKSAIVFGLLPLFVFGRERIYSVALGVIAIVALAFFLLFDYVNYFQETYLDVESQLQSEGGFTRALMTFAAAVAFFIYRKQWKERYADAGLWTVMAFVALAFLPAQAFSSTGSDRLGLYLLPFQIVVFSRIPTLISDNYRSAIALFSTLIAYALVLWTWLHYSTYAQTCWIPYNFALH